MRKVPIDKRNHHRAILTDTLPYEVPLYFTNEPLYRWLSDDRLRGASPSHISSLLIQDAPTKPFFYRVRKSGGGLRKLAIPHPAAQIGIAGFYKDFDQFIENVCSRSPYSLRYPARVGSHFYQAQYVSSVESSPTADEDPASFETQRKWASSYFSYKRFTHIHKFFGSTEFLRLEQRFSWMLKLDIARCFESIYTHSIAWAIRGKEFGKENRLRRFFESEFDRRMQASNWGETNGILIGPEFSRIFAEAIMQSIDVEFAKRLADHASKLAVVRYVDDFFIFSNSKELLIKAQDHLEAIASNFNLHLNPAKTDLVSRPFVAPFVVARQRVRILLTDIFRVAAINLAEDAPPENFSGRVVEKTLAEVRRIASQFNVDYAALASPALAVISGGVTDLRRRMGKSPSDKTGSRVEPIISSIIRISTFFYLMDIRAATSDKLAKVFLECSRLNQNAGVGRLAFEGTVQDSLRLALAQARLTETTGPEIINVLIAVDAVCDKLKGVSNDFLRSALGVEADWTASCRNFNYFDLVAVLYFSARKHSFREAREAAMAEIEDRISALGSKLGDRTEETMLFFDYVSCPHIKKDRRFIVYQKVAKALGGQADLATAKMQFNLVSKSIHFVAWDGARHFRAMLARRELQPAYDS